MKVSLFVLLLVSHVSLSSLCVRFLGFGDVVIIGRGLIVGKPISLLMENAGAIVTTCDVNTKDISLYTKHADIVISCVGKPNIIKIWNSNFISIFW